MAFLGVFLTLGISNSYSQITYNQDFAATTHGWTTAEFTRTTTNVCATTASLRRNLYSFATTGITASPTIGASNGGVVTLNYQYKIIDYTGGGATPNNFGTFKVQYSTDNVTWFDVAGSTVATDHVPATTCATKTLNFSVAPSTATYIRFNATWGAGDYYLYFDEVSVTQGAAPSCVAPSGFVASGITSGDATITWNATSPAPATGYEYYYSDVNTAPTGAGTPTTALTANLSPLNPNTTYYVWLRSDCSSEQSTWNGPFSFKTSCVAFAVPFTEGFNASSTTQDCWTVLNVNADADAWNMNYATTPIEGDQSAALYTDFNAGANNDYLISPRITLNGNQRLVFKYKVQSAGEPNDFQVLMSTTGVAPTDFTTTLSPLTSYSNTAVETKVIALPGVTGDVHFAWHVPAGGLDGWYLYIDEVVVEDIPAVAPTCSTITAPTTGAINVSNSTVTWTASLDATGYYVSAGYASGATDVLNLQDVGNVTSFLIPTDPGTTYFVTVIPYNAFGQATGCMEISFTTCDEIGDFSENFDTLTATGQLTSCWTAIRSNGASPFSSVNSDTTNNSAPYSIALYNSDSPATSNIMLVTPYINNLSNGTNRLRFFARNSTATQDIQVGTMSNPADASTFTVLQTVDVNTTFAEFFVDFSSYAGTDTYIAFRRLSTSTYTYVYIDNVIWEPLPATAPSCASNIVATPNATCGNFANSISWDATAGADGYYVTIGTTPGGTNIVNAFNNGSSTSYSFSGTISTTYYYTIVPYNAIGSATGCTEQSFSTVATGCYCTSAPVSVDETGITNVQIVATNFANTVSTSPVYNDHTATPVDMSQGINNNVQISFNTATYDYNTIIWIDLNDDYNFDASEIVYTGLSSGTSPNTLNASFVMPGTAPLGQHRMRIVATDSQQVPSNPCYSGTYGETADFTINVIAATCTPPTATTTIVPACGTAQFSIDVNVTALGSGTPSITDGTTTWPVSAIGVVNVGPFADSASVTLSLLHGSDSTCDLPLGSFTYTCPAANDNLCNAIPVTVNATSTGSAYNNIGATGETSEPVPGCFSNNINGSVWFSFVAPASGEVNITTDIAGATLQDTEIAVYAASGVTCSDLTTLGAALGCDQDSGTIINYNSFLNLAGLTAGATYYIQVDDYGFGTTKGTFGLEVQEVLASDSFDNNSFVAYPNPVKDVFNVSYTSDISTVKVMNLLGQVVISNEVNTTSTQIDMSQLSAGAYIVNVTVGGTTKTIKVVKQ